MSIPATSLANFKFTRAIRPDELPALLQLYAHLHATDDPLSDQGWGKALLACALEFAWSQNCYKAMLLTGGKDEATLRFYEVAGFDQQGKQAFVAKPPAGPPTPRF